MEPKALHQDMRMLRTPAEYAKMKYVTPKTVYNWLREGTVRGYQIGKRQFVKLD